MAKQSNGPVFKATYTFLKESPNFWVYEMGRPGVGNLYVPKALVPKKPKETLTAEYT